MRLGLLLPYMLGLDCLFSCVACFCCFSFLFFNKKKERGRKLQIFIPLFRFSYILCIFTWRLSSWCIKYFCFYITESSCLISAKFSYCIYLIDSWFPHMMKMCTIQGSPKVHFFLISDFLLLKILLTDYLCARIVKFTNSLVEPSRKNSGFLSKL
jgi:hypothetical protein